MNYLYADRAIKDMNRRNLRTFEKLKPLKFDNLNVFQSVSDVYEQSIALCKKRYRQIALDAYEAALILAGIEAIRASTSLSFLRSASGRNWYNATAS